MENYSGFISMDNKRLLWDLLLNNNIFTNISSDKEALVKKLFESKVSMIADNYGRKETLSNLNKKFIAAFVPEIKKLKVAEKSVSFTDRVPYEGKGRNVILEDGNIVTSEKQMEIRETEFKNDLKKKQDEFMMMNKRDIPDKIDFSDKTNEEGNIDIDRRMKEIMENRSKEMKTLFKDITPPNKVIENTVVPAPPPSPVNKERPKRLVIGNNIIINDVVDIPGERNQVIHNRSENNDLSGILNDILANQRIILEKLAKINIV